MFGNQQPLYGNPYTLGYQQPQAPARNYYTPMATIPQQQTVPGLIQVTGLEAPAQSAPEYVTREEFNELKEMIANGKQPVRKAKPAAEEPAE